MSYDLKYNMTFIDSIDAEVYQLGGCPSAALVVPRFSRSEVPSPAKWNLDYCTRNSVPSNLSRQYSGVEVD
jgi:hypothetical protein